MCGREGGFSLLRLRQEIEALMPAAESAAELGIGQRCGLSFGQFVEAMFEGFPPRIFINISIHSTKPRRDSRRWLPIIQSTIRSGTTTIAGSPGLALTR